MRNLSLGKPNELRSELRIGVDGVEATRSGLNQDMKKPILQGEILSCRIITAALMALGSISACASTIFTNNASIGFTNTAYEGMDIVISTCTVTMDGTHGFNSLHVAAGGVLTHSFAPSGVLYNLLPITNESQGTHRHRSVGSR